MPPKNSGAPLLRRLLPTRNAHLRNVLGTVEKVLDHDANVLILGESGVGKDFLAEAIHLCSSRRSNPFVRIDCGSIPVDLFESELFGYEKGAFTDAQQRKRGKIEEAQRGTLYLDEVGTLSLPAQTKLLRVVQEKHFTRLGGSQALRLDARILASSNRPIDPLVASNAFRQDLYYRLNVVSITLPPLRERREDIAPMATRFLKEAMKRNERKFSGFDPEAMTLIESYSWPGNLRELRSVVDRASILEESERITPESLPLTHLNTAGEVLAIAQERQWTLDELEERYIRSVLRTVGFNYSRAATVLGINRKTLLEKRRRYGIE